MTRILLAAVLLAGPAAPVFAAFGDDSRELNARNWDVVLDEYPAESRAAREQGPVGFKVFLDGQGNATSCEVTSSSGYPRLDDATCRLILTRAAFKGIFDQGERTTNAVFVGVLKWKLPGPPSAPSPVVAPAVAAAAGAGPAIASMPVAAPARVAQADTDQIICRKKLKIGSLAAYERICLSKADWKRQHDLDRDYWEQQQGLNGSTSSLGQ
jgi:TonB family protein